MTASWTAAAMLFVAGAAPGLALDLLPPQVTQVDWNTRSLVAADLDGDGLQDLAILNNDRARIELLIQGPGEKGETGKPGSERRGWRPVLEDALFRRDSIVTGMQMYALAAGDLNRDGRPDLAVTGSSRPLTILYQDEDGTWDRTRELDVPTPAQWISTVRIADLDGDGANDLVLLTRRFLLVFHQSDDGELDGPRRFPLAEEASHGLVVRDLNGDGRPDLLYLSSKSEHGLRARLQTSGGTFGPERAFPVAPHPWGVSAVQAGTASLFAGIHPETGLLQFLVAETAVPESKGDQRLFPRQFSVDVDSGDRASYALGDFDGDGRRDLAVGDRRGARVFLLLQQEEELFGEPRSYPSYPEVASLAAADTDGDGRDELFVLGAADGIGVAGLSEEGRLSYPRALAAQGTPLALESGDMDGNGKPDLVYLYEQDGDRGLAVRPLRGNGAERRHVLADLRTDPTDLRLLDANQDGRLDVAVFVLQSPMRLLLQDTSGDFRNAADSPAFRPGLIDRLLPSGLTLGDIDGDGHAEMLVAGTGFARALRVTEGDLLEVVDQFNARDSDVEIGAALAVDLDEDGGPELVLVEKGGGSLQVLHRDEEGVFRFRTSVETGSLDLVRMGVDDLNADGHPDLLLLGKRRVWWIPVEQEPFRIRPAGGYETLQEEMVFTHLAPGDLDGDGMDEIVVLDATQTRLLEVLQRTGDDWNSILHFTVFESDPHYAGRRGAKKEPRELLISDVTGDGRNDLVLLVHDRVLVYAQPQHSE